jgi:hypothetical protein
MKDKNGVTLEPGDRIGFTYADYHATVIDFVDYTVNAKLPSDYHDSIVYFKKDEPHLGDIYGSDDCEAVIKVEPSETTSDSACVHSPMLLLTSYCCRHCGIDMKI